MTSTTRPVTDGRDERRAHLRIPAAAVPDLQARLADGPMVRLLDVSRRGVQIATTMHMRPGRMVVIRFLSGEGTATMTSAVVRSSVAVLEVSGEVTYHTALAFTDEFMLCDAEFDEAAATSVAQVGEMPAGGAADYTMIVVDGPLAWPTDATASQGR